MPYVLKTSIAFSSEEVLLFSIELSKNKHLKPEKIWYFTNSLLIRSNGFIFSTVWNMLKADLVANKKHK